MPFFEKIKINKNITCIKGISGELMYLIEGSQKAVLLDTGLGYGDIKSYINQLTLLPYDVLLSHGHLDHAGGSFLFERVFINYADIRLLKFGCSIADRKLYLESLPIELHINDNYFIDVKPIEVLPIEDGDQFDLGGLTLQAISAPGHTLGSMCFLIKEKRILFTGDACSGSTFLFLDNCLSIEEYKITVNKLKSIDTEYDQLLISHLDPIAPKSTLQDVLNCCNEILNGVDDQDSIELKNIGTALVAKKLNSLGFREDGEFGNIFYRKDNIYIK